MKSNAHCGRYVEYRRVSPAPWYVRDQVIPVSTGQGGTMPASTSITRVYIHASCGLYIDTLRALTVVTVLWSVRRHTSTTNRVTGTDTTTRTIITGLYIHASWTGLYVETLVPLTVLTGLIVPPVLALPNASTRIVVCTYMHRGLYVHC